MVPQGQCKHPQSTYLTDLLYQLACAKLVSELFIHSLLGSPQHSGLSPIDGACNKSSQEVSTSRSNFSTLQRLGSSMHGEVTRLAEGCLDTIPGCLCGRKGQVPKSKCQSAASLLQFNQLSFQFIDFIVERPPTSKQATGPAGGIRKCCNSEVAPIFSFPFSVS